MDVLLFKYLAAKNGDAMRDVARALKVSTATISNRLTNKRGDFSRGDIAKLKARWKLTPQDIDAIFFSEDTVK
ncbi:hypothetical protein [Phascolarctobacterium succinatutens]|uniref:hypothetical protein n=1 Tax=Phascolarctobacterium succinatutens TaxID=626940 RepID=UPI00266EF69C|nr:hypothetical protein [Phascolarctobacterium succinatutens]